MKPKKSKRKTKKIAQDNQVMRGSRRKILEMIHMYIEKIFTERLTKQDED